MTKIKSIAFRVKVKGNGIVNFDEATPTHKGLFKPYDKNDNAKFAKKSFIKTGEKNENGYDILDYKLKISGNSLRHHLYKDSTFAQSPSIIHSDALFYNFITSMDSLMKGYMFTKKNGAGYKRKSPLTITDAIQTCNAKSVMEFFSRSGQKVSDDENKDTTIYKKETVGDIEYMFKGFLDISQLQFVSADDQFDRLAFNPDQFELFKKFISLPNRLPNFSSNLGYYKIKGSTIDLAEVGVLFTDEELMTLVKSLVKRLLSLSIKRNDAFANVESLEVKFIQDPVADRIGNEEGWVKITDINQFDEMDLKFENFYEEVSEEIALDIKNVMIDNLKADLEFGKEKKNKKGK